MKVDVFETGETISLVVTVDNELILFSIGLTIDETKILESKITDVLNSGKSTKTDHPPTDVGIPPTIPKEGL